MSLAVAILALAFLVLIHEAGHFFTARAVGMRPRKFYVGFPPALAKVTRGGIEYGIGTIPLGGYVKIPGMHRPAPSDVDVHLGRAAHEEEPVAAAAERLKGALVDGEMERARAELPALAGAVEAAELTPPAAKAAERGLVELADGLGDDAYWRQRTWKKVAVILAGPATNFALAVVLFTILLMQGTYQVGVRLAAGDGGEATTRIEEVLAGSPAERAGLRPGDTVVTVDGERVSAAVLLDRIQQSEGRPLDLTVRRAGELVAVDDVRAREIEGRTLAEATGRAFEITGIVATSVAEFFPRLVQGEGREDVASPVGITDASAQALDRGVEDFLFVVGLISLSLALLNLLPLLPLDGGHIAFSIVEGVRRRAIGREVYERVSIVGIAVVLFLFVIGLSNDIGRISS
ncbi:MAG TPA: M50 family metallopeptidase [Gaiellaceae bacterium]|nr:M50 family metallopeptidase [Gaiellaceae bacterium]